MLHIPMKQSMNHALVKRSLQPGTECVFILALYFGACVWGNICFMLIIPCLLAACFKRTATTKKNKCVEHKTPSQTLLLRLKHKWRGHATCGHAHQQQDLGENSSSIQTQRNNSPHKKNLCQDVGIFINARKYIRNPTMLESISSWSVTEILQPTEKRKIPREKLLKDECRIMKGKRLCHFSSVQPREGSFGCTLNI